MINLEKMGAQNKAKRIGRSPEQVTTRPIVAEVLLCQWQTIAQGWKAIEISEKAYYLSEKV